MWSFRLRGPKGKAAALSIAPDATMKSLCDQARPLLALPKTKPLALRSGFPPRVVTFNASDEVQSVLARNDTVVVELADASDAATAPTVIQGAPSQRTLKRAAPRAKKQAPAKVGVHTLGGAATQRAKSTRAAAAASRNTRGEGVRLGDSVDVDEADGQSVEQSAISAVASGAEPPSKYQRVHALQLSSKEQIAVNLMNAVQGTSTDRSGKFFRAATKTALEYEHETMLANARLNAALAKQFEIQLTATPGRVGSAADGDDGREAGMVMTVKFKEGVRKWHEETVELLHGVELKAALKYVLLSGGETGKEMLKPFNMAQCSPRVFWSIARLYDGDVAVGLADLLPEEDWQYLGIRTRAMSKKAIEAKANEEQWKQWKKQNLLTQREPQAERAIENEDVVENASSVENENARAVESSDVCTTRTGADVARLARASDSMSVKRALRAATARAALSRLDIAAQTADVVAAFKQERAADNDKGSDDADDSNDEIEQTTTVYCDTCSKARVLSAAEAALADVQADTWTCANLARTQRAASCDTVDDEVEQITGSKIALLLQKAGVHTRAELADATPAKTLRYLVDPLEMSNATLKERLASMIDEARLDEVNDWMSEIVGEADLVELLEVQKLGTPADLVTTPLDLVYDAVQGDDRDDVSVERVQTWREQARESIAQHAWLADWRTL